jgi:hypothetical protein
MKMMFLPRTVFLLSSIFPCLCAMQSSEQGAPLLAEYTHHDGEEPLILIDEQTSVVRTALYYKIIPLGFKNSWAYGPAASDDEQKILDHCRCYKILMLFDRNDRLIALGNLGLLPVDMNDEACVDRYINDHLLDHEALRQENYFCNLM